MKKSEFDRRLKARYTHLSGEQRFKMSRLDAWITFLPEVLAWYEGKEYTGHTLLKREKDWFLIVRAKKHDKALVSFVSARDAYNCWKNFSWLLGKGHLEWKEDKYRK